VIVRIAYGVRRKAIHSPVPARVVLAAGLACKSNCQPVHFCDGSFLSSLVKSGRKRLKPFKPERDVEFFENIGFGDWRSAPRLLGQPEMEFRGVTWDLLLLTGAEAQVFRPEFWTKTGH
jgi:hypothetical protein